MTGVNPSVASVLPSAGLRRSCGTLRGRSALWLQSLHTEEAPPECLPHRTRSSASRVPDRSASSSLVYSTSSQQLAPRLARGSSHLAQQMRSNLALRSPTNHYAPALRLRCYGLLHKVSWWPVWWGSLDGMQGVRGSNPLSSTRHNASAAPPLRAVCQQIVSRSRGVTVITLLVVTGLAASERFHDELVVR
jgi:hypothetical protein